MGFFDDLLKKLGATLATRYGIISSGEYEGCHIALGNPPKAKVSTAESFSQMIFLKDKEEVARFDINGGILDIEYIKTIQFPATGNDGYRCKVTYPNGETFDVDLFPSKVRVFVLNTKTYMRKETLEFFNK